MIPSHTLDSLQRYVNYRLFPGSFLQAVLSNDLFEAVNRADHQNKESFVDIVTYIYDHCPSICWGSRDIVNQWLEQKKTYQTLKTEVDEQERLNSLPPHTD